MRGQYRVFVGGGLVLAALAIGYWAGRSGAEGRAVRPPPQVSTVYTCSMHPQVRLNGPGACPICQMPLVPASSVAQGTGGGAVVTLSPRDAAMARVETVSVDRRPLDHEVRSVGRVEYNETSLATITARVDGYAERLFVNFTGVEVQSGDHLVEIYSPELVVAQQELLLALAAGQSDALLQSTAEKIRRLGLTAQQVQDLMEHRRVTERLTLLSPMAGTVIERNVITQAAFKAGDILYRIASLDTVWVYLEVYESQFPLLRYGQRVSLTAEAVPGRTFEGRVTFVTPLVDEKSRTIRVPVHIDNLDHALKPGMFVTAAIHVPLSPDGTSAPTGVEGRFTCTMHPQVLEDRAGDCPSCGMPLVKIPEARLVSPQGPAVEHYACPMKCEGTKTYPQPGHCPVCQMRLEKGAGGPVDANDGVLAVPVTAVLDSGLRRLVYVERSAGLYEAAEVTLGPRAGAYFPVLKGLKPGDRVAVRGGFLLDSQAQISGQPSLFYPQGAAGHEVRSQPEPTAEHRD